MTGESKNEDQIDLYHLFVRTTPNPTSGVFIIIPKKDTRKTELSIEEALKSVISGGMLASKKNNLTQSNRIMEKGHFYFAKKIEGVTHNHSCLILWSFMSVIWKGEVQLCCMDNDSTIKFPSSLDVVAVILLDVLSTSVGILDIDSNQFFATIAACKLVPMPINIIFENCLTC